MGIPSTIVTGTVAYAVLGCVLLGVIFGMQATNTMSKDNAQYVGWKYYFCGWLSLEAYAMLRILTLLLSLFFLDIELDMW